MPGSARRSSLLDRDEARKLADTNFVVNARFKPFALRDGNLITGQQQFSGAAAAELVVERWGGEQHHDPERDRDGAGPCRRPQGDLGRAVFRPGLRGGRSEPGRRAVASLRLARSAAVLLFCSWCCGGCGLATPFTPAGLTAIARPMGDRLCADAGCGVHCLWCGRCLRRAGLGLCGRGRGLQGAVDAGLSAESGRPGLARLCTLYGGIYGLQAVLWTGSIWAGGPWQMALWATALALDMISPLWCGARRRIAPPRTPSICPSGSGCSPSSCWGQRRRRPCIALDHGEELHGDTLAVALLGAALGFLILGGLIPPRRGNADACK